MTQSSPRPTAPPTSSLPPRGGRCVWGRVTKPRAVPSGVASTRMPPSGPSPLHWSETRSSVLRSPPRSRPAVRARPSAAVAVGKVPWRTRASSTSSVVTAASPRTVPSTVSARARLSATPHLLERARHVGRRHEADEPAALGPVRAEEHVGRHAGDVEARHELARALVGGGHVDLERGEPLRGPDDRRIAERRALHLPAGEAPLR